MLLQQESSSSALVGMANGHMAEQLTGMFLPVMTAIAILTWGVIMIKFQFENGIIREFKSLGYALEWAHKNSTRVIRYY